MDKPELIKVNKEEINSLPLIIFEGDIHCVKTDADIKKAIKILKKAKIIGFDTETRPNFKKGVSNQNKVALLQLSTLTDAFLFKLPDIKNIADIFNILENKKILKIGVAIKDDLKALNKILPLKANNFIDLQNFAEEFGFGDKGLRNLSGIILKQKLSKAQQLSNWEKDELEPNQQIYAATDAWICIKIYNELLQNFKKI